jgi:hypothetical protein
VKAKTEVLNHIVRQHEIATPWDHQEIARILHEWFERFNREFFADRLPLSFLRFEPSRSTTLGHYLRGRNSVGALHEINLNTLHLDRPLYEVLATLLHEMTHEWQDLFGRSSKRGYHNREFTAKCQALGIPSGTPIRLWPCSDSTGSRWRCLRRCRTRHPRAPTDRRSSGGPQP